MRAAQAADPRTPCARMTSARARAGGRYSPPGGDAVSDPAPSAHALGSPRRARPRDLRARRAAPRPRARLEPLVRARPPDRGRRLRAVDDRDPALDRHAAREGAALSRAQSDLRAGLARLVPRRDLDPERALRRSAALGRGAGGGARRERPQLRSARRGHDRRLRLSRRRAARRRRRAARARARPALSRRRARLDRAPARAPRSTRSRALARARPPARRDREVADRDGALLHAEAEGRLVAEGRARGAGRRRARDRGVLRRGAIPRRASSGASRGSAPRSTRAGAGARCSSRRSRRSCRASIRRSTSSEETRERARPPTS